MYLARFEIDADHWVQACLDLRPPTDAAGAAAAAWWDTFARLAHGLWAVPGGSAATRVVLDPAGRLVRRLFVLAPAAHEPLLRRYVGGYTRLDAVAADSVGLPATRADHDALADGFPRWHARVAVPPYAAGDAWLACDFRAADALDDLLVQAAAMGYSIGHQAHVRPVRIPAAAARVAARNALRVRDLPGAPPDLVGMQQRLAGRLPAATAVCEEILGAGTPDAADWLARALTGRFRFGYGRLRFDTPGFGFAADGHADELAVALHATAFREPAVDELTGSAIDDQTAAALLAWQPTPTGAGRLPGSRPLSPPITDLDPDPADGPGPSARPADLPPPYEGDGRYAFVSYRHADIQSVGPVLRRLVRGGCPAWYDHGIPGGSEWDAHIEDRLARSEFVVFLLSPGSVASKYCRREVKFADTLNKPILTVRLADARLTDGMHMLLTQYQMIDAWAADFDDRLRRALAHLRAAGPTAG